jgi:hypothetical protein
LTSVKHKDISTLKTGSLEESSLLERPAQAHRPISCQMDEQELLEDEVNVSGILEVASLSKHLKHFG